MAPRRLTAYLVALLGAVGLLVWHQLPRAQPGAAPPLPRSAGPICPAGEPKLTSSCVHGTGGEIVLAPCDGSPPERLAPIPGGQWDSYQTEEYVFTERLGWGARLVTMKDVGETGEAWVQVGVPYLVKSPARLYRAGIIQVRTAQGHVCPAPMYGDHEIVSFPDVRAPEVPLVLAFRAYCAPRAAIVSGCLRYEPPLRETAEHPLAVREADGTEASAPVVEGEGPAPDPAEGQGSGEEAAAAREPQDDPLDALGPCPKRALAPQEPSPRQRGPLEWLPLAEDGEEQRSAVAPSAMDMVALARRYVKGFDLEGPITPAMRREGAELQRQADWNTETALGPLRLAFDMPVSEVPGHLYLLRRQGPAEVRVLGASGAVEFDVDRNGCEVRGRRYAGRVLVSAQEEGVLLWSAEPVEWGKPRSLVRGKDLLNREVPATENENRHYEVTLRRGSQNIWGRAATAELAGAYLVQAGNRELLWADWTGEVVDGTSCQGITVYAVGEELVPFAWFIRGECM